jgi:hypothetical protein
MKKPEKKSTMNLMKPAIKSLILCGAATMLFAVPARPAHAQWGPDVRVVSPRIVAPYGRETIYREIAPYDTLTIARSTGLRPVGRPVRRGPNYELLAIDTDGVPVRVTIDARAGRVLDVRATGPAVAPYRGPPRAYGRRFIEEEPVYSRRYEDPRYERRYDETVVGEDARTPVKPKSPEKAKPKKTASKPAPEKAAAKSAVKNPNAEKAAVQPVAPAGKAAGQAAPQTASTPAAAQGKSEQSKTEQNKSEQSKSDAALIGSTADVDKSAATPKAETPQVETPKADVQKADAPKAETPKVETPKAAASSESKETQGSATAQEKLNAPDVAAKPEPKPETVPQAPAAQSPAPAAPPVQTYE